MQTSNPNNLARLTRIAAWALCAAPLVMTRAADTHHRRAAAPDQSTSQPTDTRVTEEDSSASPTDAQKQWEQVQPWMRDHCPNRLAFVESMHYGPRREQARRLMIDRYHQVQRFPYMPMREAVTKELEAQDQIFGAQLELRKTRGGTDSVREAKAEADLRAAVNHLFDAQQRMRRVQLKRHQEEIERLKGEIDTQERRRSQLVENWFKNMKNRADSPFSGAPAGRNGRTQNASPNDPQRPAEQQ